MKLFGEKVHMYLNPDLRLGRILPSSPHMLTTQDGNFPFVCGGERRKKKVNGRYSYPTTFVFVDVPTKRLVLSHCSLLDLGTVAFDKGRDLS